MMKTEIEMVPLVFFRESGFYMVPCPQRADQELTDVAKENAECNPGTLRVEDMTGNVLWAKA